MPARDRATGLLRQPRLTRHLLVLAVMAIAAAGLPAREKTKVFTREVFMDGAH